MPPADTRQPQGLDPSLARRIAAAAPGSISLDVPLSRVSRWRIGGPAAAVVEPRSAAELASVLQVLADRPEPVHVIGDTSNLLFDSKGFVGVLIRIGRRMARFEVDGAAIRSQAGASMPTIARAAAAHGLSGIEHTIGVPGTLGGLVLMNGGSQRKGIGLNVETVTVLDSKGDVRVLDREACGFAYRTSVLQGDGSIVTDVTLQLEPADPELVRAAGRKIMLDRLGKFPSNQPNCGSTFLSDPAMYATVGPPGRAIEAAGLKGSRCGGALISPLHANFIVNTGRASSDDVLWLIALMRSTVQQQTGYSMDCEARFLSYGGSMRPAHTAAEERWGSAELTNSLP